MNTQYPHENNDGLARVAMNDAPLYALAHMLYQRSLEYTAEVLEGDVTDLRAANATLRHDIMTMLGGFEQVRSLEIQRLTVEVARLQGKHEGRTVPRVLRPTWLAKGQLVEWRGQEGTCRARIVSISEPQPGNYVLTFEGNFQLNYRQVIPVYEIGDEA